jgi:hypothetical protein
VTDAPTWRHVQVLESTEEAATRNLHELQKEIKKTEEHLRRRWGDSLTSCVLLVAILVTFLFTFFFMRAFPKRRLLLW